MKRKPTTAERYSNDIMAGMHKGNLATVIHREKYIRFTVNVGRHLLTREMDFSVGVTAEDRELLLHNHYRALLKEALELDAMELLKIAQCPKCRAWFPSFDERNEHRRNEHSAGAAQLPLKANLEDPFLVSMRATDLTQGQREITPSGA